MASEAEGEWEGVAERCKEKVTNMAHKVDSSLGLQTKFETAMAYSQDHPLLATVSIVSLVTCSVPIACFIAFVLASFMCTFIGFLFLEGVLVTIGGVVLCFTLCFAAFTSLLLSGLLAMSYLSFQYGNSLIEYVLHRYRKTKLTYKESMPEHGKEE